MQSLFVKELLNSIEMVGRALLSFARAPDTLEPASADGLKKKAVVITVILP